MPSKKPCGSCCCNECESRLPTDLRCCCHCICQSLCVTITFPSGTGCSCDEIKVIVPYDCETDSYYKTVNCGDLSVDLDFSVKKCNDGCYLCLTSDCLDMPYGICPDDCKLFTAGRVFCRGTYNGIKRSGGMNATWENLDFSDCGDGYCTTATIDVVCADVLNLDKKDDCGLSECDGCGCICDCLCVSILGSGGGIAGTSLTSLVCYDLGTMSWNGIIPGVPDDTWSIFIEKDAYGQCSFRLETSVGTVDEPDSLTTCSDWLWNVTADDDEVYVFSVRCAGCGDCDLSESSCCPGVPIPTSLVATVTNNQDCGCADGAQIPLTLVSESNPVTGSLTRYEGSGDFGTCGEIINIVLECRVTVAGDCSNFELDYVFDDNPPCSGFGTSKNPVACTCDPFFLDFSNTQHSADGCCQPASASSNFHFTVTE